MWGADGQRALHTRPIRRNVRQFKRQQLLEITVEIRPIYVTDYALGRYASHLDVLEADALAAEVITEDELHRWRQSLEQAQAESAFFLHVTTVLVAGRNADIKEVMNNVF